MASSSSIDVRSHLDLEQRARIASLARHSVSVIESNQSTTGAYAASPNFPVYRYCWFRDGAFIADAMSRRGRYESADAFFAWCARVVEARGDRVHALIERRARGEAIAPEDFLACRYTLDGEESPEEWWEFQLDGYGTWLWSLDQHAERGGNAVEVHSRAVELTVRYLATFWDEPCYDWWEEHPSTGTPRHSLRFMAVSTLPRVGTSSRLTCARLRPLRPARFAPASWTKECTTAT